MTGLLLSKFIKACPPDELRESVIIGGLNRACNSRRVAEWCLRQALKYEGAFFSVTARTIMRERFGITIGAYSYGACFDLESFGPGTTIGRYVSIAQRVRAFQANHPLDRLSTHGFFFNSNLGYVPETNVPLTSLTIEHDAWIGDSVIITPGCRRIGLGAVVGAGSIVTKDVPDFAVIAGNPARLIKWRFSTEMQETIRNSKWWELPIRECARHIEMMSSPLGIEAYRHVMLQNRCGKGFSSFEHSKAGDNGSCLRQ